MSVNSSSSDRSPSSSTARATPTIPSGGLFSLYAEAKIDGSARAIYEAIVDTDRWPMWNTFVPTVEITHRPGDHTSKRLVVGTRMTLTVKMTTSFETTSKETVNMVDEPAEDEPAKPGDVYRICWTFSNSALVPRFMLHAERVNEIEVGETGQECLYRTWETFGGPAATLVKWKFEGSLHDRFQDWTRDLKSYVEQQQQQHVGGA